MKNSCKQGEAKWEQRQDGLLHCSYCGSLHLTEAVKLLKRPGTHFSGSDWKYGWPHKFYIADGKFYNKHLFDITPEELAEFDQLSIAIFGIHWTTDDEGLMYQCPRTASSYGWQRYGVIDPEGKPEHRDTREWMEKEMEQRLKNE